MKMDYALKVYNKDWRLVREIPLPKSSYPTLETLMRLPSQVALITFVSMSVPVYPEDIQLVQKAIGVTLYPKRDHYVIEATRRD
jgi:hypothetical protein